MLSCAQHQVSPGAHGSLGRPSVQADRLPPDLLSPSGPPPHAHFRLSSVSHVFLWSTHVHVLSDPASFTLGPCRVAFLGPPFTGGYQSACETQLVRVSEGSSGPQGEAQAPQGLKAPKPRLWPAPATPQPSCPAFQPHAGSRTPRPAHLSQKGLLCLGRLTHPSRPCRLLLGSVSPEFL